MLKDVSIWIGSVNDKVVSLTVEGNPYAAASVTDLVEQNPEVFSLVQNPNGQTDLAFKITSTITNVIGQFKQSVDLQQYGAQSWDYVGGQPKTRCPQCP